MARFHRFTTMIVGMLVAAVGIGLSALAGTRGHDRGRAGSIWIVAAGILIFSFGEMMASPTSQEYVGRIAPADKKALYMGYYFVAVALGNLFGGILSGQLYGTLARDMQRPDLMWLAFGGVMLFTAVVFMLYNKFALPSQESGSLDSRTRTPRECPGRPDGPLIDPTDPNRRSSQPMDPRNTKLAEQLIDYSVELKPGEKIYIEIKGIEALELGKELVRFATLRGGIPFWYYNDESLSRNFIKNAGADQFDAWGQFHRPDHGGGGRLYRRCGAPPTPSIWPMWTPSI